MRMRIRLIGLSLAALLLLVLTPIPEVHAQQAGVRLRLGSQTPWNSPANPTTSLRLQATNAGVDELQDLSLVVTVYDALLSRSEFLLSLTEDVGAPLKTETVPLDTVLEPGATEELAAKLNSGFLEPLSREARVYPMKLELLSGSERLAELRTPLIFLPRKPQLPLALGWTFVLGHPIDFAPDGTVLGTNLERRLAADGSLAGEIGALRAMSMRRDRVPVDVVISPTLVADLVNMQDGYEVRTVEGVRTVDAEGEGAVAARQVLDQLRGLAQSKNVELSTMPYGVPDLTQLVRSGLGRDIPLQIDVAREDLAGRSIPVVPDVMRPPGSSLDDEVLRDLENSGVEVLLVEAGVVEREPQPKGFAPSAVAQIGGSAVIAPDEGLSDILGSSLPTEDPRLATQVLLGDLASIWLEQPDVSRSVALLIPSEQELSRSFFDSFVREIAAAPWLAPASAHRLAQRFPADGEASYRLSRPTPFPDNYLEQLERSRELIEQWHSTQPQQGPGAGAATEQADSMMESLLLAEGSYLVQHEPRGLEWIAAPREKVEADFAKVRADTQQVVTLTSSGGQIPVRITNLNDHLVRVRIQVVSSRLRFPSGDAQDLTIQPGETLVPVFEATARTTGTFPVKVFVLTPAGAEMSETTITVRSTAFNRIALLITLSAVITLIAVWLRRSRSRRKD